MYEMNQNEYLGKDVLKSTEIVNSKLPQSNISREVAISYDGLLEVLFISVFSLASFYFLYKKSKLYLDKGSRHRVNIFKRFVRPSCNKCRFFNQNSYIKCAVHPVIAGKPEAKDCIDYWQEDRRKFFYR